MTEYHSLTNDIPEMFDQASHMQKALMSIPTLIPTLNHLIWPLNDEYDAMAIDLLIVSLLDELHPNSQSVTKGYDTKVTFRDNFEEYLPNGMPCR
jgi:hypothetical protein